jgi:hypothetical protein
LVIPDAMGASKEEHEEKERRKYTYGTHGTSTDR